jgi:hypothetical protein
VRDQMAPRTAGEGRREQPARRGQIGVAERVRRGPDLREQPLGDPPVDRRVAPPALEQLRARDDAALLGREPGDGEGLQAAEGDGERARGRHAPTLAQAAAAVGRRGCSGAVPPGRFHDSPAPGPAVARRTPAEIRIRPTGWGRSGSQRWGGGAGGGPGAGRQVGGRGFARVDGSARLAQSRWATTGERPTHRPPPRAWAPPAVRPCEDPPMPPSTAELVIPDAIKPATAASAAARRRSARSSSRPCGPPPAASP